MKTEQKALIVTTDTVKTRGLDELNIHLGRGWRVAHVSPMGGAAYGAHQGDAPSMCLAALVILERPTDSAIDILEQVGEQAEELLDEISEGDGSHTGLPGSKGEEE
jgi:hypothetical protein